MGETHRPASTALRLALDLWTTEIRTQRLSLGRWLALVLLQCERGRAVQRWEERLPRLLNHLFPGDRLHTACMETARLLLDRQRPALASAALLPLGERWRSTSCLALLRGCVLRQSGQIQQAEESLRMALQDPALAGPAAGELGELARQSGQFDQAAHWLLQAIRNDPGLHWAHHALQFTPFSPECLPAVLQGYRELVRLHPQDGLVLQLHSHYLLQAGHSRAAAAVARHAARLDLGPRQVDLAPAGAAVQLPEVLIIGVPKSGTTSLHSWLSRHPQLWLHPRKELHFFDLHWPHGANWYASQFPRFSSASGILRGETTPNYFHDPRIPKRVCDLMPTAKLIVLLRDPLERAISWIAHLQRHNGLQGDPEALLLEECRTLEPLSCEALESLGSTWPNALYDSCYDVALRRWQTHFSNQQLLVLPSETLFQQPAATLQRVARFLGVADAWPMGQLLPCNQAPVPAAVLRPESRERLQRLLKRHNRRSQALWREPAMGDWPAPAPTSP